MSGICGIVRFDGNPIRKDEIQNMLNKMPHRGNDSENIYIEDSIGFGHKMLWTTPESLYENQPLVSSNGSLVLTADIRIDNRDELIQKLNINKNEFNVISDADLILLAYQKWGEECPKQIIGDFAFVIWDTKNKKLFSVRDRLGLRPFYYASDDKHLIFASEISALHDIVPFRKKPNINAIRCYLNCDAIDYDQTFFENIFCLPPASQMLYSRHTLQKSKYWQLSDCDVKQDISFKEASKKFSNLFEQSVKSCLRSAYTIGCELSGGLDSSSVFLVANSIENRHKVLPFSFRFGNMSCDEGDFIDAVLEKTKIESIQIAFDEVNSAETIDLDQFYRDYPDWPNDMNAVMTIPLIKEVQKRDIHVLLTGQGGDQITTGNLFYLADYAKRFEFIKLITELSYYTYPMHILKNYVFVPLLPNNIKKIIKKYILHTEKNHDSPLAKCDVQATCNWEIEKNTYQSISSWKDAEFTVGPANALWANVNFYQQLGSFGIEARHPFYDTRLIEFVFSLPPEFMFSRKQTKRILRESMSDCLPKIVRDREDKAEFNEPLKILIDTMCACMDFNNLSLVKEGIVEQEKISNILDNYTNNCKSEIYKIYSIINIEKWWLQNFRERD
jgi:asparagine synthase (glutamine-hydrolysing)